MLRWVSSGLVLWGCVGACLATTELPSSGAGSGAASSNPSTGGGPVGSGGSNGSGGSGGSGVGLAAADWSSAMLAVYGFEDGNNLGLDSSGNDLHLMPSGSPPPAQSPEHKQGRSSLATTFDPFNALESNASAFQSPPGTSLTWGAWLYAVAHPSTGSLEAIAKSGDGGYTLSRYPTGALQCSVGDGTWHQATTPDNAFPLGAWVHAVCVFDNAGDKISLSMNGATAVLQPASDIVNGFRPFGIPTDHQADGFEGFIDEAFIYAGVLSEAAVRRIHACGVDGARCECDQAAPAEYAHCGDAHPVCMSLAPCNQLSPP